MRGEPVVNGVKEWKRGTSPRDAIPRALGDEELGSPALPSHALHHRPTAAGGRQRRSQLLLLFFCKRPAIPWRFTAA